jgi:hypothetical protein
MSIPLCLCLSTALAALCWHDFFRKENGKGINLFMAVFNTAAALYYLARSVQ